MFSDALESFELPENSEKKCMLRDPESPVAPTLPIVDCLPVIAAPVDPLPIKKRKRDDMVESSAKDPRKRRREGDTQLSVAQSTPLPTAPFSSRKRGCEDDIEVFTPETTSTPVKQCANGGDDWISFEEFEKKIDPKYDTRFVLVACP